jgi:hypothetical protein
MSDINSESWRMREHLHRCPDCLKYSDCGGDRNHPCGKPFQVKCVEGECNLRQRARSERRHK